MSLATQRTHPQPDPAAVLGRAFLQVGGRLGLAQRDLAGIIGVSPASLSRVATGGRRLDVDSKEGELALLMVRVFRSLDALLGGHEAQVRTWFHARNAHLGGTPAELVRSVQGLVHVAEYLDAMRGKL